MNFITPILIVGIIGLLAGVVLAVASILLAVPKDETAEALEEILPGANCGACGFSGCSGYATAMSKGEAKPGLCSPGGEETAQKCAELLGSGDVSVEYKTALVHCMGSYDNTTDKMIYDGIESCSASTFLAGGSPAAGTAAWAWETVCGPANTARSACATAWQGSTPKMQGLFQMRGGLPKGSDQICPPEAAGGGALLQLRQGQGYHAGV